MNKFSYSIITHFIPDNKDYHFGCNLYSVYQTYSKWVMNARDNAIFNISIVDHVYSETFLYFKIY